MKHLFKTVAVAVLAVAALALVGCKTTEPTPTPTPTAEPTPALEIVKDGATRFAIVRSSNEASKSANVTAAVRLRKAIGDATGTMPDISDDWDKDTDGTKYEILVGKTNRAISEDIPADLGADEFFIEVKEPKVLIVGGSDTAITKAMDYFLETYLGYDSATETYAKNELVLPLTLSTRQTFEYPPIVYIINDIKDFGKGTNDEIYNDIARLIASVQGTLNRTAKEDKRMLYYMYDSQDQFWLNYISQDNKLLGNHLQQKVTSWNSFWEFFGEDIIQHGIVLWDPEVPSTANVAATVCSADGYFPVRYDSGENSLYTWLTSKGVEVKLDLSGMFTGEGTIPDTARRSTGSAKCDAYLWALDNYMYKCSSEMIAYVLDGATTVSTNKMYIEAEGRTPNWNQIYSHDYFIYNRCFFFDLTSTADEKPCDDPNQPLGTDAKTLREILLTISERNNGNITKLMGFPPWWAKYTTHCGHGKLAPTTLEWNFVDLLSEYNIMKEADAAHPAWMTNASVYCQYELSSTHVNNNKQKLTEEFDENTRYFTIYLGDYDSSAWLKQKIPTFFADSARGDLPLMWGINPNLSDRVPMIFDYIYENMTDEDYFVTGDCGAGYIVPSCLPEFDTWCEFNTPYMEKFNMDIVGFIINTTHTVTDDIMIAYAKIAPVGSFHNSGSRHLTVLDDTTVYMHLNNGIGPTSEDTPAIMYEYMCSVGDNFSAYRTVCNSPSEIETCVNNFMAFVAKKNDGYSYKYVDPYTLFDLVLQSGQGEYIYSK